MIYRAFYNIRSSLYCRASVSQRGRFVRSSVSFITLTLLASAAPLTLLAQQVADRDDTYARACAACHGQGIAGAPKAGDKAAWAARIAKGNDTLYKHAIEGYQGEAGLMPAKGGRPDISDDLIRAAVDHMVEMSR